MSKIGFFPSRRIQFSLKSTCTWWKYIAKQTNKQKMTVANGQLQGHNLKGKGIRVSIMQSNRKEKEMEILH